MKLELFVCDGCNRPASPDAPVLAFTVTVDDEEEATYTYEAHRAAICHRKYMVKVTGLQKSGDWNGTLPSPE